MPKVLAFYPLHYGKEFLDASIQSIYPCVDKIIILYSGQPSFGVYTPDVCPETRDELRDIALKYDKVEWIDVMSTAEGHHRDKIFKYSEGYDLILAVDADEIWDTNSLRMCLNSAYEGKAWRWGILGFLNFWKTFDWYCTDGFYPIRIYNLKNEGGDENLHGIVYHMGYCQSELITRYKLSIHGHKKELRPEWLDIWLNWQPGQGMLHPVSFDIWKEAIPFDKTQLPQVLKDHPNYNSEI